MTLITTPEELTNARNLCWEEHLESLRRNIERRRQFDNRALEYGEVTMRFFFNKKGQPGPNGYPVYIALHGGGHSDTPDMNNSQWQHQHVYYFNSVKDGICIAPRGIRDTWNTHFNPESYPLYDRLIEDLAAFEYVDLNRVYLLGFSAGGDGVYGITPYMPDRFAAANMSAGHPNGLDLTNLYNMPLELQVGEWDAAFDRNHETARYSMYLNRLAAKYGGGFENQLFVHYHKPHNFRDNEPYREPQEVLSNIDGWMLDNIEETVKVNTNAIDFVNRYLRNPLPQRVVWNLAMRAPLRDVNSHYWLEAGNAVDEGIIVASYEKSTNTITIEECTVQGEFKILINEDMLNVFAPVTVNYPNRSETISLRPDMDIIRRTTSERGDRNYQFCAEITVQPM